jgi:hypothetical protein
MQPYQLLPEEEEEYGNSLLVFGRFRNNTWSYVWYYTSGYILLSILLIPAYGVGLIMLLLAPAMIYVKYQDMINRRLFVTSETLVYKTSVPAIIPCCGNNVSEKHVMLSLITDVIVEQGWYAACFGLYTVKIENAGQGAGPNALADLRIVGLEDAKNFKKVVLRAVTAKRNGVPLQASDISMAEEHSKAGTPLLAKSFVPLENSTRYSPSSAPQSVLLPAQSIEQLNSTLLRIEQLLAQK